MVRTHTECKEIDKKGNVGNNKFTDKNKTGEWKENKRNASTPKETTNKSRNAINPNWLTKVMSKWSVSLWWCSVFTSEDRNWKN